MEKENRTHERIVQSKISVKTMLVGILNAGCCLLLVWFIYYVLGGRDTEKAYANWWLDFLLPTLFIVVVCLICLVVMLYNLLCFHYRVAIDRSLRTMTRFCLLSPKGVTLKLDEYAGYYVAIRTTRGMLDGHLFRARQEICYLVDSQDCIYQVMSSGAYRNYQELKEALGLPELTE